MFKVLPLIVALFISANAMAVTVGVVNMQKVLFTVKEGVEVRKKLESRFNQKKSELQKDEKSLKDEKDKFDKKLSVMSDSAKMKGQQDLQKRFLALETKRQKYQKEIRELESKLTDPIVKKIYSSIEAVSKKEKVDMAFEVSTTPVIYAANKKDLTNLVIEHHNKKNPVK